MFPLKHRLCGLRENINDGPGFVMFCLSWGLKAVCAFVSCIKTIGAHSTMNAGRNLLFVKFEEKVVIGGANKIVHFTKDYTIIVALWLDLQCII